jgi:glycosyltransferase involved in cell wall biosynthesis
VTIAMVVRNEERCLEAKLQNLLGLDYPSDQCQIVVVSDGSTDKTEQILRNHGSNSRIHVVLNQLPAGKAACLNDAIEWAQGEVVVFTDARQMLETGALRLLLENFADPDVGCVSGELMLGDPSNGERSTGMGLYWRIEKKVRELESASGSVVGATGALYAVRRELLTPVPAGAILDDVYIPMQVARQGMRVTFDPRARAWDDRTLSGNYQLLQIAPWLVTGQNPIRFEFVSHKLLRLVVPVALAAMLLLPLAIRTPLYWGIFIGQLLFYAMSLLSLGRVAGGGIFARIADAAGTFVVLNSAAVVALANFVAGKRTEWR